MTNITIGIRGDKKLLADLKEMPDKAQKSANRRLRTAAFALERRIKREMPRDTGRAAASWGHWNPSFIIDNDDANRDDAIWEESEDGLTIIQGTNVPYVKNLNEGSSRQAPRGFIEKAADAAQRALTKSMTKLIDEVFK